MSHDQDKPGHPVTSKLVDAVRQMRVAAADRNDVVVEMREATRTRLELLAEDLHAVIADVPADDERFDFALTSGLQPRFWIDATAHVMMGPDRRTYRFVRDTRLGRVVLAESTDRSVIVERIVTYVAMRIHERDLALAGEVTSYRDMATGRSAAREDNGRRAAPEQRPLDRINDALATMRSEAGVRERRMPGTSSAFDAYGSAQTVPDRVPEREEVATPAAQKTVMGQAQSIANAVVWVLLGIVIGAGTLLLAFQNLLIQR